jgi:hypothetical protein
MARLAYELEEETMTCMTAGTAFEAHRSFPVRVVPSTLLEHLRSR